MANKKICVGMLVMALAFGMTVVGCGSLESLFGNKTTPPPVEKKAPATFRTGSGGESMVLPRQGLDFNQAFREVLFILSRHGFEPEMMQPEGGYIRTRWSTTWVEGSYAEVYRVRVLITFNPARTQVIINAPAEYLSSGTSWQSGYDSRAIETLRTDIAQSVGN